MMLLKTFVSFVYYFVSFVFKFFTTKYTKGFSFADRWFTKNTKENSTLCFSDLAFSLKFFE